MEFETAKEASVRDHPYYRQGYADGFIEAERKYSAMLIKRVMIEPHQIIVTTEEFERLKREATND